MWNAISVRVDSPTSPEANSQMEKWRLRFRDISERRDLPYQQPAILADLKSRLQNWEAELAKIRTDFLVR